MKKEHIQYDAGFLALALRLVIGWTYFSAFWRRTVLATKLDPDVSGYIGEKFNHFLPNALGIKPIILYLVEQPNLLWMNMLVFTIIEGIVGLCIMLGLWTRLMSLAVIGLATGILLASGWIGTTCLDEWQIGILGVATGFVLFLTGSGRHSMDRFLISKKYPFTQSKAFLWLGSGILPLKAKTFSSITITGAFFILFLSLYTNQMFHGGLWGPLHNLSVKPKIEITEGSLQNNTLAFDIFRTEGVDVYGSWVIDISLLNKEHDTVFNYVAKDLTALNEEHISNYYIAKVKPSAHSLMVPLGAKARINLTDEVINNLPSGSYTIMLTDISGVHWEHHLIKP